MNNIEKIKEVMNNDEFVTRIVKLDDPELVQKAFSEQGIDFTLEQINQIAESVLSNYSYENGELPEEALDAVSGGVLAEIAIVASGIALFANTMAEVNKSRKAAGKKTIW